MPEFEFYTTLQAMKLHGNDRQISEDETEDKINTCRLAGHLQSVTMQSKDKSIFIYCTKCGYVIRVKKNAFEFNLPESVVNQLGEITKLYNQKKKAESPELSSAQVAQCLLSEAVMNPVTLSIFEDHIVKTYLNNSNPPVNDGGYYSKSDLQKAIEADLPQMEHEEYRREKNAGLEDDGQPDFHKEITDLEGDELPAEEPGDGTYGGQSDE